MPTQERVHIVEASEDNVGERLDHLLARALGAEGLSRSRIQSLIREGEVRDQTTGDIVTDANLKVKSGASFLVHVPEPKDSHLAAQDIPLNILHEDDALLVLDKPAGQVIHPAPGHRDDTLVNALLAHCGESLSGIGGISRPGIVHRLDKDTSGVLVVAKSDAAHQGLAKQFSAHGRDGALQREYIALVWGRPIPDAGRIDLPIGRSGSRGSKGGKARLRMRAAPSQGGKEAVTRYRVTHAYKDDIASRLICELETGRTHQIRAHLSHIGHPLLGDPLYGAGFRTRALRLETQAREALDTLQRQALHAWRLGFLHPISGERMSFESPPPEDLHSVETALAAAN